MPMVIEATYRVVTPLFCAGADNARPELRLPSFKGVLRFWWRALAWPRCAGDLKEIQCREARLFGSADGGQSRVLMRLAPMDEEPQSRNKGATLTVAANGGGAVGDGARYLGYGVMEAFGSKGRGTSAGQLTRGCLYAPFEFTVQLRCRDLCEAEVALLCDALIALGTLGGMGAKSRKGYGSLTLQSLLLDGKKCWSAPESVDDLQAVIGHLRCDHETDEPSEYTAFSSATRHILLSGDAGKPLQLLDRVGRELVRYRSWGRNGNILGNIESERNFKDDHDLMKDGQPTKHQHRNASGPSRAKGASRAGAPPYPRRIAFGLPHNYGKQRSQMVEPQDFDRRASPLFIHIHECGRTPVAVLSFLPGRFLPQRKSRISVGGKKVNTKPEKELYRPIHDFLDRLLDEARRKERFSKVIEARP